MKLSASFLFLLAAEAAKFPDPDQLESWVSNGKVTDTLNIKFVPSNDNALKGFVQRTMAQTGCNNPHRLFSQASEQLEEQHRAAGLHLWYVFDCSDADSDERTNKGRGMQRAIGELMFSDQGPVDGELGIHVVEPGLKIVHNPIDILPLQTSVRGRRLMSGSNDPYATSTYQGHYDTINLSAAWDMMNENIAWSRAKNVVVQVIDSGWDMRHVDSGDNKWQNQGEICGDGIDNDGNGFVDDCYGYNHADGTGLDLVGSSEHGSHCSGTIAANTDNGVGVAGIAGGLNGLPGASIMTSVIFGKSATKGIAEAFVYGADNGAHISSNSWGYTCDGCFVQSTADAIDYATNKNVIVVFAAGNDNSQTVGNFPASYAKVIGVAATNNKKVAADFTNYGDWVDISAPGVSVVSTGFANAYWYMSGTSMACPHVAGVLALGKAVDPDATPSKLKNCLLSTADSIDALQTDPNKAAGKLGAGMVNAAAFLECMQPPPVTTGPPPTTVPPPATTLPPPATTSPPSKVVCGDISDRDSCNTDDRCYWGDRKGNPTTKTRRFDRCYTA